MTQFEIIILIIIYMICYGFVLSIFMKEGNVYFRIIFAIISLLLAFYVPLKFGAMLYEHLKK